MIDRTEAMTVVDVNTGKFVGSGGNLEETVTKNNLEAAEEIVRQLRLRDIGGIIVVDFIDMVLESNRDLVLRRLVECLSRDRTKHQVAEVTSLGLVQMTRKKLGLGLLETFSEPCEVCAGRGIIVHHDPVVKHRAQQTAQPEQGNGVAAAAAERGRQRRSTPASSQAKTAAGNGTHAITEDVRHALAQIAASTVAHAHDESADAAAPSPSVEPAASTPQPPPVAGPGPRRPRPRPRLPSRPRRRTRPSTRRDPRHPRHEGRAPAAPISTQDAEQILDSVLEALPEPKQPGQGRSRVVTPRRQRRRRSCSAPSND